MGDCFDGEIVILCVYSGLIFDVFLCMVNYIAIVGTASAPVVGDIINLAGETTLVPGTTVVTLPSGATVKLESDGQLTYDPNGMFDHIASGLEATDSFTYTLGGGEPNTATVVVRIVGTNTDPQVTIAADQTDVTEGTDAGFTLTAASNVSGDVTANPTLLEVTGVTELGWNGTDFDDHDVDLIRRSPQH